MFRSAWVTSQRWSDRRRLGPPMARLTGTATGAAALPPAPSAAPLRGRGGIASASIPAALAVSSMTAVVKSVSSAVNSLSVAVNVPVTGTSVYE
jgi:hypothetical protein